MVCAPVQVEFLVTKFEQLSTVDVMVAYPTMAEADIETFFLLTQRLGAHFHAVVDSLAHLQLIERVWQRMIAGNEQYPVAKAKVCIDVDVSFQIVGYGRISLSRWRMLTR